MPPFSCYCPAAFAAPRNDAPAQYRDGVVLIRFRSEVLQDISATLGAIGAAEIKRIGVGVHVLNVGPGNVPAAIQALKAFANILYAEPDYLHHLSGGTLPNDTFVGNQWAVQNTGQTVNGVTGTPAADERLTAAWSVTSGTNSVVVAVLDTGIQYSHPDLFTNVWNNPGGIGGCAAGTHGYNVLNSTCDPMDDEISYGGHGTHVSGILGAVANDASGVAGVNWTTSIMGLKWVHGDDTGYTSDLISAMDWVIHAKQAGVNVRVMNDSATWPGTGFSQALSDEIDLAGANDILFVTAAGNTAQNNDTIPRYPCSLDRPNMICVGASDQNDNPWSSSNYGTTTVKLAAPGVNIYSTLRSSNYGYVSGCSMASPQVAGTAALILSLGYASVATLKSMILNNVDVLPSLGSYVATGGRLNVCKAVPGCASAVSGSPGNSGQPLITGIPQYGSLLGASAGFWSGLPTRYSYQWYRCASNGTSCSAISGATTQNYALLAQADIGATIAVAVTASNSSGSASAQSVASGVVAAGSSPFTIGSTIQNGGTISGVQQWQATPAQSVNFVQFYIDGVLKQTIASSPYVYTFDSSTLSNGTHVAGIRALSSDNRSYGFYGATVTVTNLPPPQDVTLPVISGTPSVGQSLTTSNGTWTNSPSSYNYQWLRCDTNGANCLAIQGAIGSAYTVASGDAGITLRSSVTAGNSAGSNTAFSASVAVAGAAGNSISLVQSNALQGSGVRSVSVGFSSPNTSGNLIVAFVRMSSASQTVNLTDSLGNAYTDAVAQVQNSDGHQVHLFYARNIAGGSNSVTATFSSTNNHSWLAVYEYRGLSVTNPLDRTASSQGSNALPNTGATAATISQNELVFSGLGLPYSYSGTVSPGGSYTLLQQDTATSRAASEAQVVGATGSYSGNFNLTASANWSAVVATFSGSGGTTVSSPSITTSTLASGTQNSSYSAQLAATGGTTPYTWSVISGTLPTGLSLAPGTGVLSGTPTGTGTSNFTIQVTDASSPNQTATKALSLTISPAAGSSIALVQSNSLQGSGLGSLSVAFSSANHAGNMIIAFVRMSSSSQTVAITDTFGNAYTDAVAQVQTSDGHQVHIFYAKNVVGGSNTVKATFSSTNNHPWLAIYEYSGLSTTNPLDQTAHAQGSSSTPNSGSTAGTGGANELIFSAAGLPGAYSGTVSSASGYTLQQQDTATSRAATETALATTTGSFAGTFTLSSSTNWTAVVATFKP